MLHGSRRNRITRWPPLAQWLITANRYSFAANDAPSNLLAAISEGGQQAAASVPRMLFEKTDRPPFEPSRNAVATLQETEHVVALSARASQKVAAIRCTDPEGFRCRARGTHRSTAHWIGFAIESDIKPNRRQSTEVYLEGIHVHTEKEKRLRQRDCALSQA